MYKLLSKCTLLASALLLRFLLGVRHVKWLHPILNTTVTHRTEHNTHRTHTRTRVGRSMARVRPCAFILPVARGKENKKKKKKKNSDQTKNKQTHRQVGRKERVWHANDRDRVPLEKEPPHSVQVKQRAHARVGEQVGINAST